MKYKDFVKFKPIQRDYFGKMNPEKPKIMKIAKEYGRDFWDGDRKYGYGGYKYDGRWESVAKRLIKYYKLKDGDSVLDIGCGKGYILYEIKKINPLIVIRGEDISEYAINTGKEEIKQYLNIGNARSLPYLDKQFDLVIYLGTLHNLPIYDLKDAIQEIERVGKNKYITMESFRNDTERTNLFCWALTAESYFSEKEWKWLLNEFEYTGEYSLFYFK